MIRPDTTPGPRHRAGAVRWVSNLTTFTGPRAQADPQVRSCAMLLLDENLSRVRMRAATW